MSTVLNFDHRYKRLGTRRASAMERCKPVLESTHIYSLIGAFTTPVAVIPRAKAEIGIIKIITTNIRTEKRC